MKRYVWLLFALGMPLSSPLACGGDGCLRNSDCPSDQTCRRGQCELLELPSGEGGAGEEPTPTSGSASGGKAGTASVSGSGGASGAGKSGSGGLDDGGGDPGESGGAPVATGGAPVATGGDPSVDGSVGGATDPGTSSGGAGEPTL